MVSQLAPVVKNIDDIHFLSIGSMPAVLSTDVARHFQKKYTNVLRDIDRLRSILPKTFVELNFEVEFRIVLTGSCQITHPILDALKNPVILIDS